MRAQLQKGPCVRFAAKVLSKANEIKNKNLSAANDPTTMKKPVSEPARRLQEMRERVKHTAGFPDLTREQMAKEIRRSKSFYVHYEAVFNQPTMRPDIVEMLMPPLMKRGISREEILRNLVGGIGTSATLTPDAGNRVPVLDKEGVLRLVRGEVGLSGFQQRGTTEAAIEEWERNGIVIGWERVPSAPETSFLMKVWNDDMSDVAPAGSQILVDFSTRHLVDMGRYIFAFDDKLVFGTFRAGPDRIVFEGRSSIKEMPLVFTWPVVVGRVRKRIIVTDL